jgi:hypothetical protein
MMLNEEICFVAFSTTFWSAFYFLHKVVTKKEPEFSCRFVTFFHACVATFLAMYHCYLAPYQEYGMCLFLTNTFLCEVQVLDLKTNNHLKTYHKGLRQSIEVKICTELLQVNLVLHVKDCESETFIISLG